MLGFYRFAFCIFVLALFVIPAPAFFAQSTGSVSGVVQDSSGGNVPGTNITLRNLETNLEYPTVSTESGTFSFPSLLAGNYELKVTSPGFRPAVSAVTVHAGINTPVRMGLELAGVAGEVTALDGQQLINTVLSGIDCLVDRRQMRDLPSAGRDAISLLRLQVGVALASGTDILTASIHGLRPNMINITQDGVNVQDNPSRNVLFAIGAQNLDDIAEFRVVAGTIHSDSGTGAAQVNMVTPSGSNEFHGSLFEFHRNKVLNANSFFSNQNKIPRPAQIENKFGGRAGGPLTIPNVYNGRNRTFFFTAIEISRLPNQIARDRTVWTEEARDGYFKYRDASGNVRQVNLLQIAPVHKSINPITKELLDKTPLPKIGGFGDGLNTLGYRFLSKQMTTGERITGRVDHKLKESASGRVHQLEVVMSHRRRLSRPDAIMNGRDPAFPDGLGLNLDGRALVTAVAIHSSLGPHTYNEVRWGMHRPPVTFAREADDPLGQIIGFPQGTGNSPQEPTSQTSRTNAPVYHLIDNFSLVRDEHLFKWGIEVRSTSVSQWSLNGPGPESVGTIPRINLGANPVNPNGLTQDMFPGLSDTSVLKTAESHYALLVGLLNNARQTFNVANLDKTPAFVPGTSNYRLERYRELNLYFRDQWQWRPNFSWNFGLRYELVFPPSIVSGGILMPQNGIENGRTASGLGNLVLAGPREGRPFWNLDKNNFAPFVGFTFQPYLRTSIRGGYTISYTREGFAFFDGAGNMNQGLQQTVTTPSLTGLLTAAGVPIAPPVFKLPIDDVETYGRTSGEGGFAVFDRNLRTPYVQQWSFGIERELPGRIVIEARYVGNHAQALLRSANLNEVDIFENGFLQEFQNARKNLDLNGGGTFVPDAPGTMPLPIFSTLFAGLDSSAGFANNEFTRQLTAGEAGGLADQLAYRTTYANNRAKLAANFFKPYPNLKLVRYTSNASHSTYNALQLETRRRFAAGLSIQANYTFSKALTDGEIPGNDNYRSLRNKSIEKHRADWDVSHTFNANYLYDLPIGPGHGLNMNAPFLRKLLEGWQISGLMTWRTSPYKTFTSGRLTVNQVARMMPVPIGNAVETIRRNIGVFRTPQGVFWLNPELLNIAVNPTTGLATGSTLKPGLFRHPEAGEIGYLGEGMFKTPRFFQTDFSIMKKTRLTESSNLEFRAEFFNFFNNANFIVPQDNTSLDSQQFGRITNTYASRFAQLTMRVNW